MPDSGWNLGTLKQFFDKGLADQKEYFERRFTDHNKSVVDALAAAEKAVDKAEKNAEKWREQSNEWRDAMMDRESRFASRDQVNAELAALREQVNTNRDTITKMDFTSAGSQDAKDEGRDTWRMVFIIVSAIIGIGILTVAVVNMVKIK